MPTYDYECTGCGETLEVFQSFKDKPKKKCPSCEKNLLRRVISGGIGVVFKGSGFYANDSKATTSGKKEETNTTDKSESTSKEVKAEGTTSTEKTNTQASDKKSSSESTTSNKTTKQKTEKKS